MIEPCWYKLNIDCSNALRKDWSLPDTQGKEFGVWGELAKNMFTPEWLKEMSAKGIFVGDALIFYREPGHNTYNAHVDIHKDHPRKISTFGLNMVIDGEDAPMTWYKTPKITQPPQRGAAGTVYYNWPIDQLTELDRHILGPGLTLVRVGIPHTVIMGNRPRWCISARASLIEQLYWKDVVKYMRERDLLVERDDVQEN